MPKQLNLPFQPPLPQPSCLIMVSHPSQIPMLLLNRPWPLLTMEYPRPYQIQARAIKTEKPKKSVGLTSLIAQWMPSWLPALIMLLTPSRHVQLSSAPIVSPSTAHN